MEKLDIKKSSGNLQDFSRDKLCESMINAGVGDAFARQVCSLVREEIKPGDSTNKIFRSAFQHLLKDDMELAARYALERAVNSLGPAGFLFEQYVEAVLKSLDYDTERNVFVEGECVTHEIDVVADKGSFRYLVEAKYRNGHKVKTHIDQVMYADARLQDIRRKAIKDDAGRDYHMFVITNAYFTKNSIQYSECRDIKLFGWRYPKDTNLMTVADRHKLYPVTVLPSLTRDALAQFAKKKVILLQDLWLYSAKELEEKFGIRRKTADKLHHEIQEILKPKAGN